MEDSRDYELMDKVLDFCELLNAEELEIAQHLIEIIDKHLNKKHFREKIHINVRALVKTFEDLNIKKVDIKDLYIKEV